MPIQFHYWPTPNGWKVSIALAEMALPFDLHLVDIGAGDQFRPDFLAISPNNKMPAILDPDGPGGAPVSIFESGAILLYLARKTGRFGGRTERERVAVEQWLMWQVGGLGPMAGQAHHFLRYAPAMDPPRDIPYAKERYRGETARLYRVLDTRLSEAPYVAGDAYTVADMAIWPWASLWEGQQQTLDDKPHLAAWLDRVGDRPGVRAGRALEAERRGDLRRRRDAHELLFGQKG
jgi:GST-like protein